MTDGRAGDDDAEPGERDLLSFMPGDRAEEVRFLRPGCAGTAYFLESDDWITVLDADQMYVSALGEAIVQSWLAAPTW